MLEEVLNHLHNRFERDSKSGTFTVSDRTLEIVGMQDGQYFWVEGSVFNDGLHRYPDRDMHDEEFEGRIQFLAIPRAVLDLADEIGAWREANADVVDSPYQSESFDGYTYSKGGDGSGDAASWQAHFRNRLNPWRKVS